MGDALKEINTVENVLKDFDIHKFIDETMKKKDRYVSIFVGECGISISVYPLIPEDEDDLK